MTLSEAQNILMSDPTPEDVERVAREYSRENPSESIRTPDGKSELMAFALSGWDDEVPTQYSYKQHAWTKIGDDADDSRFFTLVRTSPEMRANMVRDLRDAGYKFLLESADEYGNPQIGIDGDHGEEIRTKFRNAEWYAGAGTVSKGSSFFKNAMQIKVQDAAAVSYSEPYKVSPILWGMDITEGGVTSTIYARSKGDLLRTAKQRGYTPADAKVADAADPELAKVTRALKKAFASFEHPQKEDWEVRTRRQDSGRIWVMLFRPWNSVFHAFDVTPGKDSFEIRESEYAKKLRKSDKPAFFYDLLPLFTDALKSVKVVERA